MMLVPRRSNFDIFDDFFEDGFPSKKERNLMRTDIREKKDKYLIDIDLPGFDKENINLTLNNGYLNNVGELVTILEDLIHYEFGNIVRAKGVIKVGQEWLRFDVADRLYAIISDFSDSKQTDCVFIGTDIVKGKILNRFNSFESVSNKSGKIDKTKVFSA